MQLFEKIESIKNLGDQIACVQKYVRMAYPDLSDVEFLIPEQGEQKFVLMTEDEAICVARSQEVSALMQSEADAMYTLERIDGVATPKVIDCQLDNHIMRLSRINGSALTSQRLASISVEKQQELAERIGVFIGKMHDVLPKGDEILMPWKSFALTNLSRILSKEDDLDHCSRLDSVRDYIVNNETIQDDAVTLHSDLHEDNILYDIEDDTLGFIDFTGLKSGYRHREFVKIYRCFPEYFLESTLSAYYQQTGKIIDKGLVLTSSDMFDVVTWDQEASPCLKQHVFAK